MTQQTTVFEEGASQVIGLSIASGGTTTEAFDVSSAYSLGFIIPVLLTGATLTVHVGTTLDGTFYSTGITLAGAAGVPAISAADRETIRPFRFLKLVSASSEASARTVYVVTKD